MNKKKGDDLSDKVLGFLLGLGAGTIVYGLLSLFQKNESKSFCPVCNTMIDRGISQCSKCKSTFSWRQQLLIFSEIENKLYFFYETKLEISGIFAFSL